MAFLTRLGLCLALAALPAQADEFVLAQVAGEPVHTAEFYRYLAQVNPRLEYASLPQAEQRRLLENYVTERLDAQRARAQQLQTQPDTAARLAFFEQRVLAEAYRNSVLAAIEVSDAEIAEYYEGNQALFAIPPRYLIEHLVYREPELAVAAQQQLLLGNYYHGLARARGSETGPLFAERNEFTPDILLPQLREPVMALSEGQTADLIHSSYGYHVIRLVEKTAGGFQPLTQVRADIESRLRQAQSATRLKDSLHQELRNGTVQIHLDQARAAGRLN